MIHEKGCKPLERIMISLHWFWVAPIMPGSRCFALWASSKRVTLMEFLKGTLHLIWEFDLIGNNKIVIKVVSFNSYCRNVRWLKEWVQTELCASKASLLKKEKKRKILLDSRDNWQLGKLHLARRLSSFYKHWIAYFLCKLTAKV